MNASESPVLARARAYRARRLRGIEQDWGLVAVPSSSVPAWTPRVQDGDRVWIPRFLEGSPPSVTWMCRFMYASGYDAESSLFWLTSPKSALRGERPIALLLRGPLDPALAAFISHRAMGPSAPS